MKVTTNVMADEVGLIGRCGSRSFNGEWGSFCRLFATAIAQSVTVASVSSIAERTVVSAVAQSVAVSAVDGLSIAKVIASLQLSGVVAFLSKAGRNQRHHQQSLKHESNGNEIHSFGSDRTTYHCKTSHFGCLREVASRLKGKRRVCVDLLKSAPIYTNPYQHAKKRLKSSTLGGGMEQRIKSS